MERQWVFKPMASIGTLTTTIKGMIGCGSLRVICRLELAMLVGNGLVMEMTRTPLE
jgi:hypothetical protein